MSANLCIFTILQCLSRCCCPSLRSCPKLQVFAIAALILLLAIEQMILYLHFLQINSEGDDLVCEL